MICYSCGSENTIYKGVEDGGGQYGSSVCDIWECLDCGIWTEADCVDEIDADGNTSDIEEPGQDDALGDIPF